MRYYAPLGPRASAGNLLVVGVWTAECLVATTALVGVFIVEIPATPRRANAGNVDFSGGTLPAAVRTGSLLASVLSAPHAVLGGRTSRATNWLSAMLVKAEL